MEARQTLPTEQHPQIPPPPHEKPGVHTRIQGWFYDIAELRHWRKAGQTGRERHYTEDSVNRGRAERGTCRERPEGPTTAGLAASDLEAPEFSLLKNGANNTSTLCVLKGKVEVTHLKIPITELEPGLSREQQWCFIVRMDVRRPASTSPMSSLQALKIQLTPTSGFLHACRCQHPNPSQTHTWTHIRVYIHTNTHTLIFLSLVK